MADEIVNKVANSALFPVNLEDYYRAERRIFIDLKDWLYEGIMLREKDYRAAIAEHDFSQYADAYVAVDCTEDAIVPTWAYMLMASSLAPHAKKVVVGSLDHLESVLYQEIIDDLDVEEFRDQRIILKGCGDKPVPMDAFVAFVQKVQPVAKSIMFGEPCSTVPVFKKRA